MKESIELSMDEKCHGIHASVCQNRRSTLHQNDRHWSHEEELAGQRFPTHAERVLQDLGIQAYSTQAKGPIERQGGMFQDRLIAEMVLEKITEADIAVITLACFPENTSQAIGSCSGVTLKLIRLFWKPKMLRSTAPAPPEYRDNRPRWHGVRSGV